MSDICMCKTHTLYTYVVKAPEHSDFYCFNGWEYTGVHSCKRCSGDFSDRHYLGSSTSEDYQNIKNLNPDFLILKSFKNFDNCTELDFAEKMKVNVEYILRSDTFNRSIGGGRSENPRLTKCAACLGTLASHTKNCILYKAPEACLECDSLGSHKKKCSRYSRRHCEECNAEASNHFKVCSMFTERKSCDECGGQSMNHKKECLLRKESKSCDECNGRSMKHKQFCSSYKKIGCLECKSGPGNHKAICSKSARGTFLCESCGSKATSTHRKGCEHFKYATQCEQCGSKGSGTHFLNCSLYIARAVCLECDGKSGKHKKKCSLFKRCSECNGGEKSHYQTCSKRAGYKKCQECLSPTNHKKDCSNRRKIEK